MTSLYRRLQYALSVINEVLEHLDVEIPCCYEMTEKRTVKKPIIVYKCDRLEKWYPYMKFISQCKLCRAEMKQQLIQLRERLELLK